MCTGDAKALKPRHCEYFMIVLRVQERAQGLQGRIALDKVCCPLFELVKGHTLRQDLGPSDCQFQACVLLDNMFDFRKDFQNGSFESQIVNHRRRHRIRVSCHDSADKVKRGE